MVNVLHWPFFCTWTPHFDVVANLLLAPPITAHHQQNILHLTSRHGSPQHCGFLNQPYEFSSTSPRFCLMLGLGLFLLKPDSGLDESDCRSATLRTFLLEHTDSILSASSDEKQVQPGAELDSHIFV